MRQEGIQVTFKIPINFDEPDDNGVIYPKEVVEKALNTYRKAPIIFMNNKNNYTKVIGVTLDEPAKIVENEERNYIEVNGILRAGGSCESCFSIDGNTIKGYSIDSIGICES